MIVSHRYKFIFIKVHKTAGTSMELALGQLCGPEDIVTPLERTGGPDLSRNFFPETPLGRAYAKNKLLRKLIDRRSPLLGAWYWEHMPAARVRELVGETVWKSYYKFCFERNPWAKVASYYNWKKHGQKRAMPSFREYVLRKTHRLPRDADLYFDGDVCLMDDVYDYNGFLQTFDGICKRLGLPYNGVMPREKTGVRQEKADYRDYYDEETKAKVAACFSREITLMGYTFDPEPQAG